MSKNRINCPQCHQGILMLKHEARYVYSYTIDSDAPGLNNSTEFLPFLYDKREQKESIQYIECDVCGKRHPLAFSLESNKINVKELEGIINSFNTNSN